MNLNEALQKIELLEKRLEEANTMLTAICLQNGGGIEIREDIMQSFSKLDNYIFTIAYDPANRVTVLAVNETYTIKKRISTNVYITN